MRPIAGCSSTTATARGDSLTPELWALRNSLLAEGSTLVERFGTDGAGLPKEPLPRVRAGIHLAGHLTRTDPAAAALLASSLLADAEANELMQPIIERTLLLDLAEADNRAGPSSFFWDRIGGVRGGLEREARSVERHKVVELVEQLSEREHDLLPPGNRGYWPT